jgi:hypothetical protein
VSAFAPVNGSAAEYSVSPQNADETVSALVAGDPLAIGATRIDTGDLGRHPAILETFYGDVDVATAEAAIGLLQPDGPFGIPAVSFPVTARRFGIIGIPTSSARRTPRTRWPCSGGSLPR